MVNWLAALKRPFLSIRTLVLLAVLPLIPIVSWIGKGYHMRCAQYSMRERYETPPWNDVKDLFVLGFFKTLINWIYGAPLVILLIASLVKFASISGQGIIEGMLSIVNFMRGVFALYIIFFIIYVYVRPAALMSYAASNKFRSAFDYKHIFSILIRKNWFFAWGVSTIFLVIFWIIYYLMLSWLVVPIAMSASYVVFYLIAVVEFWAMNIMSVITWSIFGEGYGRAYYVIYSKAKKPDAD